MSVQKRLKGKNIAHEHLPIAQSYVDQLIKQHAIAGIVLLGGTARGFADKHSDIDLAIFVDDEKTRVLRGEVVWHDFDIDHMVLHLESWAAAQCTQLQRQTFSEGRVLYDPKGRISRLLKGKHLREPAGRLVISAQSKNV